MAKDESRALTGRFKIDRLDEAVDALEFVLEQVGDYGAHVPEMGRLRQHLELLRSLQGSLSYPSDPRRRASIATALGDAAQFSLVASVLPPERAATLVQDVSRAVKGAQIRAEEDSAEPYQFQSQLVFGAMLAAAEHDIVVPNGEGFPDFIAPIGNWKHGIEVKRPSSPAKLERAFKKGADQVARTGGCGLVVVDVSDILGSSEGGIEEPEQGPDIWRIRFVEPFRRAVDRAGRILCSNGGHAPRSRFHPIAAYCVFATGWTWITSTQDPGGWPEYRALFYARRLYRAHDLSFHRGGELQDMIEHALQRFVGGLELTRVE